MDFATLILISAGILAIIALLLVRIARAFRIRPYRWSFAASYLVYLAMVFTYLYMDPPSTIAWQTLVPVALAFPTSLLVIPFGRMGGEIGFWVSLGCFGSIQYFLIGILVERIGKRMPTKQSTLSSEGAPSDER